MTAQLVLDRVPAVFSLDISLREPRFTGIEHRPLTGPDLLVAAARAQTIRLSFSPQTPRIADLADRVRLAEQAIGAAGRRRGDVRVLLDLDVVIAPDARTARRKRAELEYLDALSGLTWSPAETRVVTTAELLVDEVSELAERAGVDGVVLHPLSGGDRVEQELRALIG